MSRPPLRGFALLHLRQELATSEDVFSEVVEVLELSVGHFGNHQDQVASLLASADTDVIQEYDASNLVSLETLLYRALQVAQEANECSKVLQANLDSKTAELQQSLQRESDAVEQTDHISTRYDAAVAALAEANELNGGDEEDWHLERKNMLGSVRTLSSDLKSTREEVLWLRQFRDQVKTGKLAMQHQEDEYKVVLKVLVTKMNATVLITRIHTWDSLAGYY